MGRFNRVVVAFAAALALAAPGVAYAQHGGHGGGGHAGSSRPSGGRAPSSMGTSVAAPAPVTAPGRNRTGQPVVGTAAPRTPGTSAGSAVAPFYFPGGFGYGGYGGYGLGFNPFFGSAAFGLGWGYNPFFYDPLNPFGYGYFGYGYPGLGYGYPGLGYGYPLGYGDPMGYGGLGYGYPGTADPSAAVDPNADPNAYDGQYRRGLPPPRESHATGAIRLKVSPDSAQVYIDGTLAGTAGEFDGLVGHHLVLETGPHELELRADGHETFHDTIMVEENKTLTERATLKKAK